MKDFIREGAGLLPMNIGIGQDVSTDPTHHSAVQALLAGVGLQSQGSVVSDPQALARDRLLTGSDRHRSAAQHAETLPAFAQREFVGGKRSQVLVQLLQQADEHFDAIKLNAGFVSQ